MLKQKKHFIYHIGSFLEFEAFIFITALQFPQNCRLSLMKPVCEVSQTGLGERGYLLDSD